MTDDEDLEARLARWQPTELPPDLLRSLRAAEPTMRPKHVWRVWLSTIRPPWPLAYAGLLAVWVLILAFRLLTPAPDPDAAPLAQTDLPTNDAPTLAADFRARHAVFFARDAPDQL